MRDPGERRRPLPLFLAAGAGLLLVCLAPAHGGPTPLAPGNVYPRIEIGQTGGSYALYLPPGWTAETAHPVLYCFDPRGRGTLCVERFREAAERTGTIIAASNDSASDGPMEPNLVAMRRIWAATHARLRIDDTRAWATGFSGGARVAWIMGQVLGLSGVIGVGGGFPPSTPPAIAPPFAWYGLVGDRDFNYYEMVSLDERLAGLGAARRLAVFDGEHAWAPAEDCGTALEWLHLHGAPPAADRPLPAWSTAHFERRSRRAAALEAAGRGAEARPVYEALAADAAPSAMGQAAAAAAARLAADPAVRRAERERRREDRAARAYLARLAEVLGRVRAANEPTSATRLRRALDIDRLRRRTDERATTEGGRAAARLLAMVRVQTSVTQVHALLAAGLPDRAAACLEVALSIRPDDPIAWYNLACARALAGSTERALDALERSVALGFTDAERIASDPDLAGLRDTPRYGRLIGRITPR